MATLFNLIPQLPHVIFFWAQLVALNAKVYVDNNAVFASEVGDQNEFIYVPLFDIFVGRKVKGPLAVVHKTKATAAEIASLCDIYPRFLEYIPEEEMNAELFEVIPADKFMKCDAQMILLWAQNPAFICMIMLNKNTRNEFVHMAMRNDKPKIVAKALEIHGSAKLSYGLCYFARMSNNAELYRVLGSIELKTIPGSPLKHEVFHEWRNIPEMQDYCYNLFLTLGPYEQQMGLASIADPEFRKRCENGILNHMTESERHEYTMMRLIERLEQLTSKL